MNTGAEANGFAGALPEAGGLELGGEDPAYVRADAPLEPAIASHADGTFYNASESCCAVERIHVDRAIFQPFVEKFVNLVRRACAARSIRRPTWVRWSARRRRRPSAKHVAEPVAPGARALLDAAAYRPGTPYLAPQLLVDVDQRMELMREETSGPAVNAWREGAPQPGLVQQGGGASAGAPKPRCLGRSGSATMRSRGR